MFLLPWLAFVLPVSPAGAFVPHHGCHSRSATCQLARRDWDRNNDEQAQRRASQDTGFGSTATGAVLGGLLGGPFGALFGASIGDNLGARFRADRARTQALKDLGITQDMLDAAEEIGRTLEQSVQGLAASQDSLRTQQSIARRLDTEAAELYEKAQASLEAGDEEKAKGLLYQRTQTQDQLKKVLKSCAEEKQRASRMEENVERLEERAREIEGLLNRSVSAKTLSRSEELGLSVSTQDPLLQKFKDLGID